MTKRGRSALVVGILLVVVVAVVLLWPPADPLAGVDTVAIRTGTAPTASPIDLEGELTVVLGDRSIQVVTDEAKADAVLVVSSVQLNLGDVQVSLTDGRLSGRVTAVCRITEVRTGRSYVMDLFVRIRNGVVTADLVPRRFWEFWLPRPGS
jgi:hypothetical protein